MGRASAKGPSVRSLASWFVSLSVLLGFVVPPATAAEPPPVGSYELGLQSGYFFGMTNNSQSVTFLPRLGRVMWTDAGARPGAITFGIEGLFTRFFESNEAMELGGGPMLRYWMVRDGIEPYVEVGVGMLYSDLKHFSLGSRILFEADGAVGVQLPFWERFAASAGYRFRHISNAGQSPSNPGLNGNIFAIGLSYLFY